MDLSRSGPFWTASIWTTQLLLYYPVVTHKKHDNCSFLLKTVCDWNSDSIRTKHFLRWKEQTPHKSPAVLTLVPKEFRYSSLVFALVVMLWILIFRGKTLQIVHFVSAVLTKWHLISCYNAHSTKTDAISTWVTCLHPMLLKHKQTFCLTTIISSLEKTHMPFKMSVIIFRKQERWI